MGYSALTDINCSRMGEIARTVQTDLQSHLMFYPAPMLQMKRCRTDSVSQSSSNVWTDDVYS